MQEQQLYAIEFAFPVWKDERDREEMSEFVALPFIPRVNDKIAWNSNIYMVTDVMPFFTTHPSKYDTHVNPDLMTLIPETLGYKVWLRPMDTAEFEFIKHKNFKPFNHQPEVKIHYDK